jgi:hypothetical protein
MNPLGAELCPMSEDSKCLYSNATPRVHFYIQPKGGLSTLDDEQQTIPRMVRTYNTPSVFQVEQIPPSENRDTQKK